MLTHIGAIFNHISRLFESLTSLGEGSIWAVNESPTMGENAVFGRVMTLISDVLEMSTRASVVEVMSDVVYVRSRTPLHLGDIVRSTLQTPGLGTVWFKVVAGREGAPSSEYGLRPTTQRATNPWLEQQAA